MQFYKFEANLIKPVFENLKELKAEVREEKERERQIFTNISTNTRQFLELEKQLGVKVYAALCGFSRVKVNGLLANEEKENVPLMISSFLKALDLSAEEATFTEITIDDALNLDRLAERNSFIEEQELLESFGYDRYNFRNRLEEELLVEKSKEQIQKDLKANYCADSIMPEVERIYMERKNKQVFGHPVHYMVETEGRSGAKMIVRNLLPALYANDRIKNKRFTYIDITESAGNVHQKWHMAYSLAKGGVIVAVFPVDVEDEDEVADSYRKDISELCELAGAHCNDVLTIVCLPRTAERSKNIFFDYLDNITFVELRDDNISGEAAYAYLKEQAQKHHIRTDKALMERVDEKHIYLASELQKLFDEWFNLKIKSTLYPQYKEFYSLKHKVQVEEPKGNAYDDLMNMIGLTSAKRVIQNALNYFKAQKLFADKGAPFDKPSMHMVFTGAPGTAKTTVARLWAQILRDNNILSGGQMVEVGRADLVGQFVGWTAKIVQRKFKEAKGGILFIDEAYSLVDERHGCFGDEAINTIVQEMENHRSDVVVIFAGYADRMQEFLDRNPGLNSRIAFHVQFDDYNSDELCQIAQLMADKKKLTLSEDALSRMSLMFDVARQNKDFGNGRYVRNVLEQARMLQCTRLLGQDPATLKPDDYVTITAADIEVPQAAKTIGDLGRHIGFVS